MSISIASVTSPSLFWVLKALQCPSTRLSVWPHCCSFLTGIAKKRFLAYVLTRHYLGVSKLEMARIGYSDSSFVEIYRWKMSWLSTTEYSIWGDYFEVGNGQPPRCMMEWWNRMHPVGTGRLDAPHLFRVTRFIYVVCFTGLQRSCQMSGAEA